jgi:hypothetical protein
MQPNQNAFLGDGYGFRQRRSAQLTCLCSTSFRCRCKPVFFGPISYYRTSSLNLGLLEHLVWQPERNVWKNREKCG